MDIFHCDHCGQPVFFENITCVRCGHRLAYLPDVGQMASLESLPDGLWHSLAATGTEYRLCANYTGYDVCNWAVKASDENPLCLSCRLTRLIPNLDVPGNREAWYRLEVAKRRLLYTLLKLGLPLADRQTDPCCGLAFELVADASGPRHPPAVTGHSDGVITINIAEADDAERERRRIALNEPYRTLLGHFRHEIGHYYWDRLVKDSERLEAFRARFGDERQDYPSALRAHYEHGPREDWQAQFVSAYATSHPWEDWAETWAHYLHVTDTVETGSASGIAVRPRHAGEPALKQFPAEARTRDTPFDRLVESWFPLTYVLNNLNRALGLPDGYPFVLSEPAIEKMRFVHDTIEAAVTSRPTSTCEAGASPSSMRQRSADAPDQLNLEEGTPQGGEASVGASLRCA
jgi:hypothetical protein